MSKINYYFVGAHECVIGGRGDVRIKQESLLFSKTKKYTYSVYLENLDMNGFENKTITVHLKIPFITYPSKDTLHLINFYFEPNS